MYQKTDGLVLNHKNFGEADKLISIYTRDFGKISCIAKGVRKPTSRKSGHLELGSWCNIFVAKGKNIDVLTEAQSKKAFGIENLSPESANKIYHLLEIVEVLTPANQKNYKVFALLVNFLNKIESEKDFNLLSCTFKVKLLSVLGYFSTTNLKESRLSSLLGLLEKENFDQIKPQLALDQGNYLKLLTFLDSIIEMHAQRKLKTIRFING
jgi:DNA repair protein RecO (recombination protein O)